MANKKGSRNGHKPVNGQPPEITLAEGISVKAGGQPRPYRINPETPEQREKRLAKRKALTLRAFQIAYEAHKQDR